MKRYLLVLATLPLLACGEYTANPVTCWIYNNTEDPSGYQTNLFFGSDVNFPEYVSLNTTSGYVRFNYGPTSGWGASVVLLPTFWTVDDAGTKAYHQKISSFSADPELTCDKARIEFTGTIDPPANSQLTAHVSFCALRLNRGRSISLS